MAREAPYRKELEALTGSPLLTESTSHAIEVVLAESASLHAENTMLHNAADIAVRGVEELGKLVHRGHLGSSYVPNSFEHCDTGICKDFSYTLRRIKQFYPDHTTETERKIHP